MTGMSASAASCEHLRERGAVDRGDDQRLGALGDHVLDLRDLGGDVVLCVLQVDGVTLVLERRLDGVAVLRSSARTTWWASRRR